MPTPRKHENNAEKQREYRARQAAKHPTQSELASFARNIAAHIEIAATDQHHSHHNAALQFAGKNQRETLQNLIDHFR